MSTASLASAPPADALRESNGAGGAHDAKKQKVISKARPPFLGPSP